MNDQFSESDVITTVRRLTRSQLIRIVEFELVKAQRADSGYVFLRIEIARLELQYDLSQDLNLDNTVVGTVISLIDQMHAARQGFASMAHAIDALPGDLKIRIGAGLKQT